MSSRSVNVAHPTGIAVSRPRPGILVLDGRFANVTLSGWADLAGEFSVQRLGAGDGRDGLPERRERADRVDVDLADELYVKIAPWLGMPATFFTEDTIPALEPGLERWRFWGANPRLRFYRYGLGDRFAPHADESFEPGDGRRSLLTCLVYLPTGEECVGGETVIDGEVVSVVPGRVVVFDHRLLHEGRPVESGSKLVLRTDIVARAI